MKRLNASAMDIDGSGESTKKRAYDADADVRAGKTVAYDADADVVAGNTVAYDADADVGTANTVAPFFFDELSVRTFVEILDQATFIDTSRAAKTVEPDVDSSRAAEIVEPYGIRLPSAPRYRPSTTSICQ